MTQFVIKVQGGEQKIVGAPGQTTISLRLNAGKGFESPQLSASAYQVEGEVLEKQSVWNFEPLKIGDKITVEVSDAGEPDPPSRIVGPITPLTDDEKVALSRNADELERFAAKALKTMKTQPEDPLGNTLFCSFCGKSNEEVSKLISGPSVFICNECVSTCEKIISGEADA